MKTAREADIIQKFCIVLERGLKTLGYEIKFYYSNAREEVFVTLPSGEIPINVNMSSTKAVAIDVFNALVPILQKAM